MKTYQLTLDGYHASTDATDHLIKWVNAPSEAAVLALAQRWGWSLQDPPETPWAPNVLGVSDGVDFVVNEEGEPVPSTDPDDAETEPHPCPYAEEIADDHTTLCNCSVNQQRRCAEDI